MLSSHYPLRLVKLVFWSFFDLTAKLSSKTIYFLLLYNRKTPHTQKFDKNQ